MASNYQYETSPRKIQPEYKPRKKKKKEDKQKKIEQKNETKKATKRIIAIMGIFTALLVISYRNSLITEKFNDIQSKQNKLASLEKTNGQLEVSIESSLNLSNIEKAAKKLLGMKKLSKDQKVYVTLPTKDYTESGSEIIMPEEETNWFQKLINKIFNK